MTERTRRGLLIEGSKTAAALAVVGAIAPAGTTVGEALAGPARKKSGRPGFSLGFKSLKDETHIPSLEIEGKLPEPFSAIECLHRLEAGAADQLFGTGDRSGTRPLPTDLLRLIDPAGAWPGTDHRCPGAGRRLGERR